MSFSVKIPANIYLHLQINTLLACIKIRTERGKCSIIYYLSALVQLNNIRDQKPDIRDLETQTEITLPCSKLFHYNDHVKDETLVFTCNPAEKCKIPF